MPVELSKGSCNVDRTDVVLKHLPSDNFRDASAIKVLALSSRIKDMTLSLCSYFFIWHLSPFIDGNFLIPHPYLSK